MKIHAQGQTSQASQSAHQKMIFVFDSLKKNLVVEENEALRG